MVYKMKRQLSNLGEAQVGDILASSLSRKYCAVIELTCEIFRYKCLQNLVSLHVFVGNSQVHTYHMRF